MAGPELKTSDPLHITDVEETNGWYQISTDGHPSKLKTNREEGGREAGRLRVERALVSVQYAERNDKPNPRGGFYHDFYWYAAKPAEQSANGDGGDDGITRRAAVSPEKSPGEAWRICLSVGSERAVQLAPHLPQPQQDFPFIWALAYEFASRIYLTPPPNALPEGDAVGIAATGHDDDDDIPF